MNSNTKKGVFFLLTAAFLYSIMPVMIRSLGSDGIPPISQVFLRYIFAFFSAGIYYFAVAKSKLVWPKKNVPLLLFATLFGYGLTNLFFTIGILNTHVGNALFLFHTYAIIAPVLGLIFLKEKVNAYNIVAVIISFIAIALLFQPSSVSTWKLGGAFALLAALAQAGYLISRKKLKEYSASYMMLANTFFGVILLGLLSLLFENKFYLQGEVANQSATTWIVTILFGFDNFLAWFAMTKGFEYFKSSSASIILLSELIFGVIFALAFFNEVPTYFTLVGGILIIVSSLLVILKGEN